MRFIQLGYCVSDIISKCGVGLVIHQIGKAKSITRLDYGCRLRILRMLIKDVDYGCRLRMSKVFNDVEWKHRGRGAC